MSVILQRDLMAQRVLPPMTAPQFPVSRLISVTVTSPVQSESDQGELTLVPPPKEPDHILQPLSEPKTIR